MWIFASGNDQVHMWWQMLDEKGEGLVNRFGIKHVVVVKDEDELVFDGGQVIEQGRQNRFGWRWLRRLEESQDPFSNRRRKRLKSRDEVRQKAGGVVLPFVQRQPGCRSSATGKPFANERGFPKAGRSRDKGQFAVQSLVEPLEQAGAADHVGPKPRQIQFRGENGRHLLSPPTTSQIVLSTKNTIDSVQEKYTRWRVVFPGHASRISTYPFVPFTRILCPSFISLVAFSTLTTAGRPYSLATTAPWVIYTVGVCVQPSVGMSCGLASPQQTA